MYRLIIKNENNGKHIHIANRPHKELEEAQYNFYKIYEPVAVYEDLDDLLILMSSKDRELYCKYCGKDSPTVTFKNKAHAVPQALGNKHVLSSSECDQCNSHFSKYENDLIYYLGMNNVIMQKTKKKFKGPSNISAKWSDDNKLCITADKSNYTFKDVNGNSIISLKYNKNAYRPLYVYSALLKIALNLFHKDYREQYEDLYAFLFDHYGYESMSPESFLVMEHTIFGPPVSSPRVIIFKKINPNDNCVTHTACIYVLNKMFQIQLLFNKYDDWLFDGKKKILFHFCPPLLDKSHINKFGIPKSKKVYMNTLQKIIKEEEVISFRISNERKIEWENLK